jgi:hypothetical protein
MNKVFHEKDSKGIDSNKPYPNQYRLNEYIDRGLKKSKRKSL